MKDLILSQMIILDLQLPALEEIEEVMLLVSKVTPELLEQAEKEYKLLVLRFTSVDELCQYEFDFPPSNLVAVYLDTVYTKEEFLCNLLSMKILCQSYQHKDSGIINVVVGKI